MAIHHLLMLALAALPLLAADAAAQDAGRYRAWDRNNDGVITRAEWRGDAQEFRDLDWNRDGVLSGTEVIDQSVIEAWDVGTFVALDRNRNGQISRGEWRSDVLTFRRVDRNGDNQISRAEFLNADAGFEADVTDFEALDFDNSDRIERDEWNGTRAAFNRLDTNRDGTLSRRELAAGDAVVAAADDFDVLDANNNGVITRGEWQPDLPAFSHYDVNRDGVISRREYATEGQGLGADMTIIVDARQPWTDTGINATPGDLITYRAEGSIQMSTDANDRATVAGSVTGRTAANSPRPDLRAGRLLLRIGNMTIGSLDSNGSLTAQNSGRVYLGVNDDHFPDNSGEFRVMLTVRPR